MRVLDKLERAFLELAEMPGIGHRREDLTPEDFRFWSVYNYLIVYEPARRRAGPARPKRRGQ